MNSIGSIGNMTTGSVITQSLRSRPPDPAEKFQSLDTDSSGTLDKTELSELAKELAKMAGKTLDLDAAITTYDADGDGALNQEEMDTMMQETMGPPPSMGLMGPPPPGGMPPPDKEEKFAEMDTDSSGGLSETELAAMAEDFAAVTGKTADFSNTLATYDADGDGELSAEEVETMMSEEIGPPPAPPESTTTNARQAAQAYLAHSGVSESDLLQQLFEKIAAGLAGEEDTNT
jgi:Ca2+-binding EF-hand superfamily protein